MKENNPEAQNYGNQEQLILLEPLQKRKRGSGDAKEASLMQGLCLGCSLQAHLHVN